MVCMTVIGALAWEMLMIMGLSEHGEEQPPALLQTNSVNPRYFTDGNGKVIYLAGTHDGWELQDYAWGDRTSGVLFDWSGFLDFLTQDKQNLIRLWVVEHTKITDDDPELTIPMPYKRVQGYGKANDGGDKFDLDQFNEAFFQRLKIRVGEAQDRGIYVIVMLFQGWSIDDKSGKVNPWPYHPFHRQNNINGLDGDVNGNGQGEDVHTWLGEDHPVTQHQRAYVRKMIDTVNNFDNVLYEIANESHSESIEWQYHMIDYIHDYEKTKSKQHPVGMTVPFGGSRKHGLNADLFKSPADWISPKYEAPGEYNYRDNPPPADGRKVVINDTDHLYGVRCKDYSWVWKSFCRGHNPLYMDQWTMEPNDPQREKLRKALGHTRLYAQRMDMMSVIPQDDLVSIRFCLANPGYEYLIYLLSGGTITLDLSHVLGTFEVEWFNPRTGVAVKGGTVQGASQRTFDPPFDGDAVLYIAILDEAKKEEAKER